MRCLNRGRLIVVAAVLLSVPAARAAAEPNGPRAEPPAAGRQTIAVSQTFDNRPFTYRMELRGEQQGYRLYRLSYPSPVVTPVEQNNTIPADYYLPKGVEPAAAKRPAVICLHILNGNFELEHMTCALLASRGIPAVMIKLPYYGERALPGGHRALAANPKLFVEALSQGVQDVRRTIDVLASRPEVDAQHIGVVGISMGGMLAATVAGSDPRLSRAVLILAGGDLQQIIRHARETRELSDLIGKLPAEQRTEVEQALEAVDPLRHAAALRGRAKQGRVLMINAAADEVIPKACTEKLAAALGMADRVVWLDGLGHYTAIAALPQALRTTADFFAQDLPPGVKTVGPAPAARTPLRLVVALLQQGGELLTSQPQPGRCHFVDLDLSATGKGGERIEGRLRVIRGSQNKFQLHAKVPKYGEAALGQGDYPWLASGEKIVFQGRLAPGAKAGDPLAFADAKNLVKLRMLAGILTAVTLAPETLERWVTIADDTPTGGAAAVRIVRKDRAQDSLRLVLKDDKTTPESLSFAVEGVQGKVVFRAWQFNTAAHDALFEPPAGLKSQEVDAADLYRMFAAMFNFAVESLAD